MERKLILQCILLTNHLVGVSRASLDITIPVELNSQVTLPCHVPVEDHSAVEVRWLNEKDGLLTSGTRVYKHQGLIFVDKPTQNEWNLRIGKVSFSYEDIYTCNTEHGMISRVKLVIKNSTTDSRLDSMEKRLDNIENVQKEILKTVKDIYEKLISTDHQEFPNEPRRVNVKVSSSSIMRVEWRRPRVTEGSGKIQGYDVYYEEIDKDNKTIHSSAKVKRTTDGKTKQLGIYDLGPNKRYRVSVAAFTRTGVGNRSPFIIISTAVPSKPRLTVELEEDSYRVLVNWSEPEVTNGRIVGYRLHWGIQGDTLEPVFFNETDFLWKTPVLRENVTYMFILAARNELDLGETAMVILHVPHKVPESAPRNVSARPYNLTTINIEWEKPEISNKVIQGYMVFHTIDQDLPIMLWNQTESSGRRTMVSIYDLDPRYTYTIRVLAYISYGNGPLSAPVQVEILSVPTIVIAHPIDQYTVRVEWRGPEVSNIVEGYRIIYSTRPEQPLVLWMYMEVREATTATIRNLMPNSTYTIAVSAFSGIYTARSTPVQVITRNLKTVTAPSEPVNFTAEFLQQEPSIVRISWAKPKEPAGKILGYKLYWGVNSDGAYNSLLLGGDVESFTTPPLQYDAVYTFILSARNDNGYGNKALLEVETTSYEPQPPKGVEVFRVSPTTLTVTWQYPGDGSKIAAYRVYYSQFELDDFSVWQSVETGGHVNMAKLTGLKPGIFYAVRIQSQSVHGRMSEPSVSHYSNKLLSGDSCQNEWGIHGNRCYLISKEVTTWIEAREACMRLGSSLFKIMTTEDDAFVMGKAKTLENAVWIGGSVVQGENDKKEHSNPTNLVPGQSTFSGQNNCTMILESGLLNVGDCDHHLMFICEYDI